MLNRAFVFTTYAGTHTIIISCCNHEFFAFHFRGIPHPLLHNVVSGGNPSLLPGTLHRAILPLWADSRLAKSVAFREWHWIRDGYHVISDWFILQCRHRLVYLLLLRFLAKSSSMGELSNRKVSGIVEISDKIHIVQILL